MRTNNQQLEWRSHDQPSNPIVVPVPRYEPPDAGFDGGAGGVADVLFEGGGVGPGGGDVAGLHGHEFFFGGGAEGVFEGGDEVHEFDGFAAADVVDPVGDVAGGGIGGVAVPAGVGCGRVFHHAGDAFYDVIHVSEIAHHFAAVEDLDGFAFEDGFGEEEEGHVGASPGAVNGKKAEAGGGDVEEVAVGVGHQFVAFFAGGVKGYGVVDVVVDGEGHGGVFAVNRAGGCVYQVFHGMGAAGLEDVEGAGDVGVDVGLGVGEGVPHAGLGRQVNDVVEVFGGEELVDEVAVGEVGFYEGVGRG